jgi:dipeptidyl aminopeptidase/acylaminoacyl peptidase
MQKLFTLCAVVLVTCATLFGVPAASLQSAGVRPLTIETLLDIRHPSNPVWSPDSTHLAFLSERTGIANIFVADAGARPAAANARALTTFVDGQSAGFFWSADSQRIYFPRHGDLWQVAVTGGAPSAVWTTPQAESNITLSPDGKSVAFVRGAAGAAGAPAGRGNRGGAGGGGDLFVRSLVDGAEHKVIGADNKSIGGIGWTPDGSHLIAAVGNSTIRHEQTPAYSGSKIIYTISENVPGETIVVPAAGGSPTTLRAAGGFGGRRWLDSTHFVFDRTSPDFKRRTLYVADILGGEPKMLHEDVEEKFWSMTGDANGAGQPSPDGKWILFLSDRDGWDHLYVMPAKGGDAVQITKGKFEAWRPQWSPDSTRIAFDANSEGHYGDRQLYVATIGADPSHATVAALTSGRGTNISPMWSPDGTRLVYQHTDPRNSADLWMVDAKPNAAAARLSDSMPASIDKSLLVEPEVVHYAGPDGQQVPAWLFVPKNLDKTKKHPVVVWIHGDGVNQNYDGWHVQRNYAVYYSFHQYLLQQGYIVIAPDYRGSIGYGRAWRDGVYMDVGGKDAKDAWMVTNYLKTLPYVDMDRVGVWGLSYGGFFTLIAVTDQPTLFRAAVDVAGVVDYAMYYEDPYHGGWTASRIGTPEQNPNVYAEASPLSHIDRLARPLLVLHGTSDVNVPYLHSVRLLDEAMKKGKGGLISFMTYPGEFHYFTREHVLRDAWNRVDQFWNANLKGGPMGELRTDK